MRDCPLKSSFYCKSTEHTLLILQVAGSDRQRFPPPPLSTLEMQKKATGSLRIGGDRVMKLAEELYQSGYVSYPRTETDAFDSDYDLMVGNTQSCLENSQAL